MERSSLEARAPSLSAIVLLRAEAEADMEEAYLWYPERGADLGADSLAAVDESIEGVRTHPERHALVHRNVRRALLRRFPYGLFYVHDQDRIHIIACFHASRDPRAWQARSAG
jgi:plasmid stabilization system protein ParE